VQGFACLPPLVDVGETALTPGDWVAVAPLWGNPFITARTAEGGLGGCLEGRGFRDLAGLRSLQLLGDLTRMRQVVAGAVPSTAGEPRLQEYVDSLFADPCFKTTARLRLRLDLLTAQVAPDWLAAAETEGAGRVFGGRGRVAGGVGHLLQRRLGFAGGGRRALELTVGEATELQLGPERAQKEERQRKYYALATDTSGEVPGAAEAVQGWLGRVWDTDWDNRRKEKAFLLAYNGFGTAERRRAGGETCSCGFLCPGRVHHFWDCPVAGAVLDEVRQGLPQGTSLQREHIWLGRVPGCQIDSGVWRVVAVAAIEAMAKGRSRLVREKLSSNAGDPPPGAEAAAAAGACAARIFWASLQDFVSMKQWPRVWVDRLARDASFLQSRGGTLVVAGPRGTEVGG
jgi:hypothetical protein